MKKIPVTMRSIKTKPLASILRSALRAGGDPSLAQELVIEGSVKAVGVHHLNKLTIARNASVTADVHARIVTIEGRVEGCVVGDELVHVAKSAQVIGSITAPSVTLEEGFDIAGQINFRTISRSSSSQDVAVLPCLTSEHASISIVPNTGNRH
jgi:cytoskeletal protein CcmA (bactofilin family)